jgi:hypothetical protein
MINERGADPIWSRSSRYYFFLVGDGFLACDRSEPATVFSPLDEDLLESSLLAIEAGFLPVVMMVSPCCRNRKTLHLLLPRVDQSGIRPAYEQSPRQPFQVTTR